MIPEIVRFSGLDVDPHLIFQPRRLRVGLIPESWQRVRFKVSEGNGSLFRIDRWIGVNIPGRWASYSMRLLDENEGDYETIVVVAFETVSDAVLFRLKEGERAWMEESE